MPDKRKGFSVRQRYPAAEKITVTRVTFDCTSQPCCGGVRGMFIAVATFFLGADVTEHYLCLYDLSLLRRQGLYPIHAGLRILSCKSYHSSLLQKKAASLAASPSAIMASILPSPSESESEQQPIGWPQSGQQGWVSLSVS